MRLSLSLNRRVTALAAVLLPLLLLLGYWQLQRAEEKRVIDANFTSRLQQTALSLEELKKLDDRAFMPISLRGQFDNQHHFLLDNRSQGGRSGYEVLTPLLTDDGEWVLVNRGWIQANPLRKDLPDLPEVEGVVDTRGTVYVPPGKPFLLAEQTFHDLEWPLVVQAVEIDTFAQLLDRQFFPQVVRLRENTPGALEIDWQAINVQPQKHLAYAVQWFALAAALVLWFVFANTNVWHLFRAGRSKNV